MTISDTLLVAVLTLLAGVVGYLLKSRREDRHRFTDLKRERYAELLGVAYRHQVNIHAHRVVAEQLYMAGQPTPDPPPPLTPREDIEALVDAIGLLAPPAVADEAELLMKAAFTFSQFAFDSGGPPPDHFADWLVSDEMYWPAELHLTEARRAFRDAARRDLGITESSLSCRTRVALRRLTRGPGTDKVGRLMRPGRR